MKYLSFIVACAVCAVSAGAADLSDLIMKAPAQQAVNPDDVMLRRPTGRSPADLEARARAAAAAAEALEREKEAKAKAEAEAKAKEEAAKAAAEAEAKAKAEAEAKAAEEAAKAAAEAEAKAKAEAEAKAKEEAAKAAAEAEAKAKEEAEAKAKEDEAKAAAEAEIKSLREQIAREKAAREEIAGKAALDRAAAEKAAAQAVEDRKAAEKAAAQAAADRAAAEKATEAKAAAEKRIDYLQNPDPDERPKPKKLEAPSEQRDVTETVPGKKKKHKKAKGGAAARTGRDAVITSERTDYDRKEGIILFDRNVFVDDELYQMHADRLFVFLDGTNDLKRIVAIGNVSITNEQRTASCSRAVFTKAASKIVMYGDEASNAKLSDPSQRGGVAEGKKITFWLDAEQVEVEGSAVRLPGGMLKGKDPKKFLDQAK
ncbi:MAG: hypothetical protein IJL17_00235 [Kiritimatiellae bacterium]|nr:hypothetical protein [Kiritimatiellia bacterium]